MFLAVSIRAISPVPTHSSTKSENISLTIFASSGLTARRYHFPSCSLQYPYGIYLQKTRYHWIAFESFHCMVRSAIVSRSASAMAQKIARASFHVCVERSIFSDFETKLIFSSLRKSMNSRRYETFLKRRSILHTRRISNFLS